MPSHMEKDWIDVSLPLRNGMVSWPGDAPFHRSDQLQIAHGDTCNLSKISGSAHSGTHMDAPRHYLEAGAGIETMPITAAVGRARVIEIHDPELIRIDELERHPVAKGDRVLFKTRNSKDCWKTDEFQKKYVYIPPDTARYLAQREVQTVGVDYLSVGGFESGGPETHRTLLEAGIWIIEGLMLGHVQPGEYELLCLPLKIVGSDGAPARAVLRKLTL
ncbi:MAG TPA: cyclase family protein [Bryobacteraceae bacterium]|nr:cyclase family protein [Bryobacteraceae bacterium]